MRILKFPGDTLVLSESRYRLKRIGREEWLDDHANPTEDPERATDFASATDAAFFLLGHVEEPQLYHWEEIFVSP